MPQLGEIRKAKQLGKAGRDKFIWLACSDCGKGRWIRLAKGKPMYMRCRSCAYAGMGQKGLSASLLAALRVYNPEFISFDDTPVVDRNLTYHEVIPDTQVDVEKQVMARFIFRSLPKIIKRIGAKRLAGFGLTKSEQVYLGRWKEKEGQTFREEWEI